MSLAFVFAGQGSQKLGMGKDFYDKFSTFKNLWDEIDINGEYKELCFGTDLEKLSQTENTQPCMVLFAVCLTSLLKENGIVPRVACGLSLGEYSALSASGAFSALEAVSLVKFRGKVMSQSGKGKNTAMSAIIGADRETVLNACKEASSIGICQVANYNCPSQIVIGGEKCAVQKACEIILSNGGKKAVPLNVSGAFHTELMNEASNKLSSRLNELNIGKMNIPVIFNCTGKAENEKNIKELLTLQVKSSVFFEDSIRTMESMGVDKIIEIGPGKALSGFIKKTTKAIKTYSIENVEDFEAVLNEMREVTGNA